MSCFGTLVFVDKEDNSNTTVSLLFSMVLVVLPEIHVLPSDSCSSMTGCFGAAPEWMSQIASASVLCKGGNN